MAVQTKKCSRCHIEKPLDAFSGDRSRRDGLNPRCKECVNSRLASNRDRANATIRARRIRVKQEVLDHYGAICVCCGTIYVPHLTLDHVEGGGHQERKKNSGVLSWFLAYREGFPARFQIMCFNCNWAKHSLGECRCKEGE